MSGGAWLAAIAVSAGSPFLMQATAEPSGDFARWAIGGLATAVVSLAGWTWREREKRTKAEVELAIAKTKLEAYGKSAPELAEEIRRLGEALDAALDDGEGPRQHAERLVWPYDRPPRRNPRRRPS